MNPELEFAARYWTLANGIAGFAVIQLASLLLAVGTNEQLHRILVRRDVSVGVAALMAVIGLIYIGGLWYCWVWERQLLCAAEVSGVSVSAARAAFILRLAAVALMYIFGVMALGLQPYLPKHPS